MKVILFFRTLLAFKLNNIVFLKYFLTDNTSSSIIQRGFLDVLMHCISTIHVFSYSVVKVLVQMPSGILDLHGRSSGDGEIRTHDPLLARQVLSQLSYTPVLPLEIIKWEMGLSGLEPPTSRLSGVRSNLLSYKPIY